MQRSRQGSTCLPTCVGGAGLKIWYPQAIHGSSSFLLGTLLVSYLPQIVYRHTSNFNKKNSRSPEKKTGLCMYMYIYMYIPRAKKTQSIPERSVGFSGSCQAAKSSRKAKLRVLIPAMRPLIMSRKSWEPS